MKKVGLTILTILLIAVTCTVAASMRRSTVEITVVASEEMIENPKRWSFDLTLPKSWNATSGSLRIRREITATKDALGTIKQSSGDSIVVRTIDLPTNPSNGNVNVVIQLLEKDDGDIDSRTYCISGGVQSGLTKSTFANIGNDIISSGEYDVGIVTEFTGDQPSLPLMSLQFCENNDYTTYNFDFVQNKPE